MIILSMVIPTVFVGGCLYYLIFAVMAERLIFPDMIARDLIPVVQRINVLLFVGLPVVFSVMLLWALILSRRLVSPLERLEEDLAKIDEGDYSVRLEIQKDHDLAPIAGVINDLVEQLDKKKGNQ